MSFKDKVKKTIEKYGEEVSVTVGGNICKSYAYIQSDRAVSKKLDGGEFISPGYRNGEKFLYIGFEDIRLDTLPINTIISAQSGNYVLKEASAALLGGKIVYIRASLEKQVV